MWMTRRVIAPGEGVSSLLLQTGHQLDEIAGLMAIIQLLNEDFVPSIATGAG